MGKDKNEKKDFIFASIQTLGKKNQLERFKKDNLFSVPISCLTFELHLSYMTLR